MKVFIAGIDGYLGWPLAQYLTRRGHTVAGADLLLRREWVAEVGSISAIPIATQPERVAAFNAFYGVDLDFRVGDLTDYAFVTAALADFMPDAIVHLGQMPSAPYSMIDQQHAVWTQVNNITSNLNLLWAMKEVCPQAHLVKLGTMGEYGTPNIDIPEGFFEIEYRGRKDRLPFPRQAGSFYHQSKVHDSHNTAFASRIWGLTATDIMQGVVFGSQWAGMTADPRLRTRYDFDQCFGTAVNRFVAQAAIDHPLTLYGVGQQKRGYLPLSDSLQCVALIIEHPPAPGEYRVINQFEETYTVTELACMVRDVAEELGIPAEVHHYDNPRAELEEHYYHPDRNTLLQLGYQPGHDVKGELRRMLPDLRQFRDRIHAHRDCLIPDIRWDGTRRRSQLLD